MRADPGRSIRWTMLASIVLATLPSERCFAQSRPSHQKDQIEVLHPFSGDRYSPRGMFSSRPVSEPTQEPKPEPPKEQLTAPAKPEAPVFVSNDPGSHILPPEQDPKVRINPEAPGPFVAMVTASQNGDEATADAYADQYVRYLVNLMYQVRRETQRIGEALIRNGIIDEESWVGVEQYLDYQFAEARDQTGALVRPTHEESMRQVRADPKGEVDVYYFFTLNSSYCRKMAPDVERLWRSTKTDSRVKMVGLTLGPEPENWIASYRDYTGLTLPILSGQKLAKALRVRFVPAVVVVARNSKTAYLKTGQQSFDRLYEFVRTVQGQGHEQTPELRDLKRQPIGEPERMLAKHRPEKDLSGARAKLAPASTRQVKPDFEKF